MVFAEENSKLITVSPRLRPIEGIGSMPNVASSSAEQSAVGGRNKSSPPMGTQGMPPISDGRTSSRANPAKRNKRWAVKGDHVSRKHVQDLKQLGKGAFGTVHQSLLTNKQDEQVEVAVKRMHKHLVSTSPTEVKAFIQECRLMAGIHHRSIVGYIGAGFSLDDPQYQATSPESTFDPTKMFCVQELCDGGNLRQMVEKQMNTTSVYLKAYTYTDALEWTIQISEALAYLHGSRGSIVHRDLKLDNVMLSSTVFDDEDSEARRTALVAKLADFGLSKRITKIDEHVKSIRAMESSIRNGSAHGSMNGSMKGGGFYFAALAEDKEASLVGRNASFSKNMHRDASYQSLSDLQDAGLSQTLSPATHEATMKAKKAVMKRRNSVAKFADSLVTLAGLSTKTGEVADAAAAAPAAKELTQKTGSFTYMAPEVFQGTDYGSKVDVFSLGVIMYELFTGLTLAARLMISGSPLEFENHAFRTAQGERMDIPRSFPPEIKNCISELWLQDPGARPSAADAVKMLQELRPVVLDYQASLKSRRCCG